MPRKMTKEELDFQKRHPDALFCLDESLTKQSFAEECSTDEILRRAQNGQISTLEARVGQWGVDVSNIPDFRASMDLVARANSMFMELDWKLRERFSNDPGNLIAFLQDPANREEAVRLGLVKAPEAKPATPAAPAAGGGNASPPTPAQ